MILKILFVYRKLSAVPKITKKSTTLFLHFGEKKHMNSIISSDQFCKGVLKTLFFGKKTEKYYQESRLNAEGLLTLVQHNYGKIGHFILEKTGEFPVLICFLFVFAVVRGFLARRRYKEELRVANYKATIIQRGRQFYTVLKH